MSRLTPLLVGLSRFHGTEVLRGQNAVVTQVALDKDCFACYTQDTVGLEHLRPTKSLGPTPLLHLLER